MPTNMKIYALIAGTKIDVPRAHENERLESLAGTAAQFWFANHPDQTTFTVELHRVHHGTDKAIAECDVEMEYVPRANVTRIKTF